MCVGILFFFTGCATPINLSDGSFSYVCMPPGTQFSVNFPVKPELTFGNWKFGKYHHLFSYYQAQYGSVIYTLKITDLEEPYQTKTEQANVLEETLGLLVDELKKSLEKIKVETKEKQLFKGNDAIRFVFFIEEQKVEFFCDGILFFSDKDTIVFLYLQYPKGTIRNIPLEYERFIDSYSPAV